MNKKYHLIVFGCQMNYSDSERLSSVLEDLGYSKTDIEEDADLIAIISCSVKQSAVDRIYGKLRNWQIIKEKKPLITILSGCVLDEDRKKIKDKFDLFIDIKKLENLAEDIKKIIPEEKLAIPSFFNIKPNYESKYRAYIPIMTGCNKFCSYCAVPYTRGRETSRPSKEIIKEIKELLNKNYKEIILLGQNVNSYGLDKKNEIKFPELLKTIDELNNNDWWLKFMTSHPYDLSKNLIKIIKNGKHINKYLHLPVQSGSDNLLKKMNRHYNIKDYKKLINNIKKEIPNIAISTDIITGFCGETEKQYKETEKLLKDLKFNLAYISQYSKRSSTVADKLYKDDIPKNIKKERWYLLNEVIKENSLEFNNLLLNKEHIVLIDTVKEKNNKYINIGKLSNYISIHIEDDNKLKIGEFYKIKITESKSWGVKGKLIK